MTSSISQITRGELSCWQICHRGQTLVIAEQGAQVLEYRHDGEPPLIWLSPEAAYQRGQSVRGGVPVCWPWFGGLGFNPDAVASRYTLADPPAHGLVRGLPWTLVEQVQSSQQCVLRFRPDPDHLPDEAPGVTPTLIVCLDQHLTLTLVNHNHSESEVALSQALHSYFAVSDSRRITLQGLDGHPYVDALDQWHSHLQQGPLTLQGETDRLYLKLGNQLHIDDPGWQRRITLSVSGSQSAVVWNPWVEKSQRLSQFPDDAWQQMICIETARVLDDMLVLAPGQHHEMTVRFMTTPL